MNDFHSRPTPVYEAGQGEPTTTTVPARYRRDANMPFHELMDGQQGPNSSTVLANTNTSLLNSTITHFDTPNSDSKDYDKIVRGQTSTILPNLSHFTQYSIEVIACHEIEEGTTEKKCSNRAISTGRTLPKSMSSWIIYVKYFRKEKTCNLSLEILMFVTLQKDSITMLDCSLCCCRQLEC